MTRQDNGGCVGLESVYAKLALDNSPNPVFMFDKELNFVTGTRFGLGAEFEVNENKDEPLSFTEFFSHVFPKSWIDRAYRDCQNCLDSACSCLYEVKPETFKQGVEAFQIRIATMLGEKGETLGVTVSLTDVTEIVMDRDEALEASRAKTLFLTDMSHEVRTPMNVIKGLSELLLFTRLDDTQRDHIGSIVSASDSLLKIINDIIDISKIDANNIELVNATYDLASFMEDISNLAGLRAEGKGLCLITDIEPSLPSLLKGDSARIKQVLVNLISNAVKFTQEGYIKLSAASRKSEKGLELVFAVEDTGIGINGEDMPKLFRVFGKAERGGARNLSGSGLGLAISWELVQLMGGELKVESEPGSGSVFTFRVSQEIVNDEPLARVSLPEKKRVLLLHAGIKGDSCANMLRRLFVNFDYCHNSGEIDKLEMSGSYTHCIYGMDFAPAIKRNRSRIGDCALISIRDMGLGEPHQAYPGVSVMFEPVNVIGVSRVLNRESYPVTRSGGVDNKRGKFSVLDARALIVDDNEVNLIVGGEVLRQYGIEADEAESGALALKKCGEKKYDIIFMDHMMPEMDGVETSRHIRESGGHNIETPIVALTANSVTGIKEYFLDCDMNDFISKPIDFEEMSRILIKWLPEHKIAYGEESERHVGDAPEKKDPVTARLESIGIKASEALVRLDGNMGIYKTVLETFAKEVHRKSEALRVFAETDNWKDFQTEAHGMKGALGNIGARDLSLIARNMEIACKEDNLSYVREYLADFINDLHMLGRKLEMLIGSGKPIRKPGRKSAPGIRETLEKAAKHIDSLENDEAMELLDEILDTSEDEGINEKLESVKNMISVFDYDGAIAMISELT